MNACTLCFTCDSEHQKKKPVGKISRIAVICCLLVFLASCSQSPGSSKKSASFQDTIPYPAVQLMADLPDSSQARQVLLENVPPPAVIKVPLSGTGILRIPGDSTVIQLSAPVTYNLKDHITNLPIAADAQGRGLFTTYTTDEGLSLDEIYCSYKDNLGNLWFGTNGGGINKYDGKNFTHYTTANGLAYNLIWCIMQDSKGNLWVGTDGGGVSRYDGRTFTNYTTAQGLAHNVVYCIIEDSKGNIWFGTNGGGISRYDGKSFASFSTADGLGNDYVSDIEEDRKGNLWMGTRGGGISKYDGNTFTNFNTAQGLANNNVRNILMDKYGNLWIGTMGGGISKYDGKNFTNYSNSQGLSDNTVWALAEDRSGNIWMGTNKGVSKYDGKSFTSYTTDQGLANNRVTCITEDEKGNIWFGSFGGGISKYAGKSISNYTTAQGLPNNVVYSIVQDSTGNLWFGTNGGGVSKYDGKSFTNFTTSQGLVHNEVYSIAKDGKGNLWFGTYRHGLSKFNGKTFTNYNATQGLPNNTIFRIVEDKNGNLWFGTSGGGVCKYDGKRLTIYTTEQGLANNVVFSILEDSEGNLWFGTLGGGVSKFDGHSFTNYTVAQGLADNAIWAITEDRSGDLWFGTQNGLSLLHKSDLQQFDEKMRKKEVFTGPLFESYTTKEGLPHNFISQILQVSDQKLYIGTNAGMCEFIEVKNDNGKLNKWKAGNTYSTKTGYPVKDVNSGPGAMFIDKGGIIWICTGSDKTGVVRFDPKNISSRNFNPPKVFINSIKINNEKISWSDLLPQNSDSSNGPRNISEEIITFGRLLTDSERDSMRAQFSKLSFKAVSKWNPVPEELVLPYEFNNISFDFNAIETGKNHLVRYQYMLEGYDNKWSPPSIETSAGFGHIYEGSYRFLVKAQSPEGVWSEPVIYAFKVLPPLWRTWWAYTIYALLFLWMLRAFSKYRERSLRAEKEKLEGMVKHRTEMLENTIVTLKTTQTQLIQSEKMASLGELTAGIAHEIQNPLNFVNNFSEVNKELLSDLRAEIEKGNMAEVKEITTDLMQNMDKINHHGKRADAIVKGMLQHSKHSTGHKELTDINALAEEYLNLAFTVIQGRDKNFYAELETHFDPTIDRMNLVPQEIGVVMLNLYNNAFYAVAEKRNRSGQDYVPMVTVTTKNLGDKIELKVRDNGVGIPDKVQEKIFQPFFTTKPAGQGTGLGLSLSYDIIKANQGSFHVISKEDEYTEFIILLPVLPVHG